MRPDLLSTPALNAEAHLILDWLELVAFFDPYSRARIDDVISSVRASEDEAPDDFGDADRDADILRSRIESELDQRRMMLQSAYPFSLDDAGEEVRLDAEITASEACFYLLCLVASHLTGSPILNAQPPEDLVRRMRNRAFQVMGTLVVAGIARGPALSVGWPRETKEKILDVLRRGEQHGIGLVARDKPGRHANPSSNDGGVDVIGWPTTLRPPPAFIFFGQIASGNNWRDKPIRIELPNFLNDFFDDQDTGQHNHVTILPHRVVDNILYRRESVKHGYLCDRGCAPLKAFEGLEMARSGVAIDEANNLDQIGEWLVAFRTAVLA